MLLPERGCARARRSVAAVVAAGQRRGAEIATSIGIAQAPRDGSDAEALLRAADIASARREEGAGTGQVSVYSGGSLSGDGRRSARGALCAADRRRRAVDRRAADRRRAQWLDRMRIEALARFGADGKGSPLQWFSLADELGEREALERACLREALELFCRRPAGVRLSVNLSAAVLIDRSTLRMLDRSRSLGPDHRGHARRPRTQRRAAQHGACAAARARRADGRRRHGRRLSGLGQIMAVHPSYLKLDRSLISGIDADRDRAALVGALADYAGARRQPARRGGHGERRGAAHADRARRAARARVLPLAPGCPSGRRCRPACSRQPVAERGRTRAVPTAVEGPCAAAGHAVRLQRI